MLHYQAIHRLPSLEVVGFEALVRWDHPYLGLLLPGEFLPADMDGAVGWVLTNFVLEQAVRDCAQWQAEGTTAGVSVNISPGRLADELLPGHLVDLLSHYGLDPRALTVEMTEARCAVDPCGIARALTRIRELGVRLSLDDFGTGDATLARLRQIPFDEIKIDRCFISNIDTMTTDREIVSFSAALAHRLGMRVVAEGVETAATLNELVQISVDYAQGFLLHRPAPRPSTLAG